MTDTSKTAIAAVVERLRQRGGWMRECGADDDADMDNEAASLISALEAERDTWKDLALKKEAFILSKAQDIEAAEAQVATLQAKLEKAAEALEPFAQGGAAVTHAFGEALFPDNSMAFPTGCTWSEDGQQCVITWADFRRARSTLREAGNDHT